uniref:7TM_GPCR_Srx domain-containing protein n=1 Tax=Steinernema glaseri TaxID=37863 RepID=A0A1I7ZY01_9BILA
MNLFHTYDFQATLHFLASTLSFIGSFRTLWVIMRSKFYRKQKSFQIMANITVLECAQMAICFMGGFILLDPNTISPIANRVLGALLMSAWIGLVYLRLVLAVNRFATITQFKRMSLLDTVTFHWGSVLVCWMLFTICAIVTLISLDVLYMDRTIATWDYFDVQSNFRYFDRFSSVFTISFGFCLYVFTWGFIMKHKKHGKASDIRLFFAFAASFSYEIGNVISFNVVPKFVSLGEDAFRIMTLSWILLPAFNSVMLLSINSGFRKKFFTFIPETMTPSMFVPRSSSRTSPISNYQ